MQYKEYDVLIVGGGVIGTALSFALSHYSNVPKVALIEKEAELGMISSNSKHNSQTLHFGDIETNYTHEKAKSVQKSAAMVLNYLKKFEKEGSGVHEKFYKMVLGVGKEEVEVLEKRHEEFADLFPDLKKLYGEDLAKIEPCIMEGRDPSEAVLALYSEDGHTVNFGELAKSFVKNSRESVCDLFLETKVESIKKEGDKWLVKTNKGEFLTSFLVLAAGSYSLYFAKMLGHGKGFAVLPVAGDFYHTPKYLKGKVYTLQNPKIPFAAAHGDPDLDYPNCNRFGPVAKVAFWLETHNLASFWGFLRTFGLTLRGFLTLFKILFSRAMGGFIVKHAIYSLPFVGRYFFVKEIQRIVPNALAKDITKVKGLSGIRPQLIDKKSMSLSFGNAKISEKGVIFNVTPSPGASVCLQNALDDLGIIAEFFDGKFEFEVAKMREELTKSAL